MDTHSDRGDSRCTEMNCEYEDRVQSVMRVNHPIDESITVEPGQDQVCREVNGNGDDDVSGDKWDFEAFPHDHERCEDKDEHRSDALVAAMTAFERARVGLEGIGTELSADSGVGRATLATKSTITWNTSMANKVSGTNASGLSRRNTIAGFVRCKSAWWDKRVPVRRLLGPGSRINYSSDKSSTPTRLLGSAYRKGSCTGESIATEESIFHSQSNSKVSDFGSKRFHSLHSLRPYHSQRLDGPTVNNYPRKGWGTGSGSGSNGIEFRDDMRVNMSYTDDKTTDDSMDHFCTNGDGLQSSVSTHINRDSGCESGYDMGEITRSTSNATMKFTPAPVLTTTINGKAEFHKENVHSIRDLSTRIKYVIRRSLRASFSLTDAFTPPTAPRWDRGSSKNQCYTGIPAQQAFASRPYYGSFSRDRWDDKMTKPCDEYNETGDWGTGNRGGIDERLSLTKIREPRDISSQATSETSTIASNIISKLGSGEIDEQSSRVTSWTDSTTIANSRSSSWGNSMTMMAKGALKVESNAYNFSMDQTDLKQEPFNPNINLNNECINPHVRLRQPPSTLARNLYKSLMNLRGLRSISGRVRDKGRENVLRSVDYMNGNEAQLKEELQMKTDNRYKENTRNNEAKDWIINQKSPWKSTYTPLASASAPTTATLMRKNQTKSLGQLSLSQKDSHTDQGTPWQVRRSGLENLRSPEGIFASPSVYSQTSVSRSEVHSRKSCGRSGVPINPNMSKICEADVEESGCCNIQDNPSITTRNVGHDDLATHQFGNGEEDWKDLKKKSELAIMTNGIPDRRIRAKLQLVHHHDKGMGKLHFTKGKATSGSGSGAGGTSSGFILPWDRLCDQSHNITVSVPDNSNEGGHNLGPDHHQRSSIPDNTRDLDQQTYFNQYRLRSDTPVFL